MKAYTACMILTHAPEKKEKKRKKKGKVSGVFYVEAEAWFGARKQFALKFQPFIWTFIFAFSFYSIFVWKIYGHTPIFRIILLENHDAPILLLERLWLSLLMLVNCYHVQ